MLAAKQWGMSEESVGSFHVAVPGARAEFTSTMGLVRLDVQDLSMILYPANPLEAGLANLYLRRAVPDGTQATPLLGPDSHGATSQRDTCVVRQGIDGPLQWWVEFTLAPSGRGWRWRVGLRNVGAEPVDCDVVTTQDFALVPYAGVRTNEYYVSQYLDVSPLSDPEIGVALAVRQNLPGDRQPWAVLGALERGAGWCSDALQLRTWRAGRSMLDVTRLPSRRLQHEHTLAGLATEPVHLLPGESMLTGFFGAVMPDHPAATGPQDLPVVRQLRAAARSRLDADLPGDLAGLSLALVGDPEDDPPSAPEPVSLFSAPTAPAAPLSGPVAQRWFPGTHDLIEHGPQDAIWSFRTSEGEHVTARDKEHAVLRPHGQILRTGDALTPETGVLTSTVWMRGVFASQLTVGHVGRDRVISASRTYLGLQEAHGMRAFVHHQDGEWELLGVPTAWAVTPDRARWFYQLPAGDVRLAVTARTDGNRLDVAIDSTGDVDQMLIAVQLAVGDDDGQASGRPVIRQEGMRVTAAGGGRRLQLDFAGVQPHAGGDELLFADGISRELPWLCCLLTSPDGARFSLTASSPGSGDVVSTQHLPQPWASVRENLHVWGSAAGEDVAALDAMLPWFAHDAWVHYLSPRGLEQYAGGGWGTRDVCQGPVGLLTVLGRDDALRDLLVRIFGNQNQRGDWPQAFDFLPTDDPVGQFDAHGDIIYWPLLALGGYLLTTGDATVLDELAPLRGDGVWVPAMSLREHVRAAVDHVQTTLMPGTPLPAYGHGDWNDSLQPADPTLARRMVSTWTASLQAQALAKLAAGLRAVDSEHEMADRCAALAEATQAALTDLLLADGVLSGYAVFAEDADQPELLVHPQDTRTGLTYGLLPWVQAILGDQLTPEQARHHLDLLHEHLWGPDGARLFDHPPAYRGGPMKVFQRAEAATFWGREIGLMYTHAHLWYCQALARAGQADRLLDDLLLAVPMGLTARVPVARPRQTTCYYSSSDAVFVDRLEAADHYQDIKAGLIPLEGGWRVYSSGPGLFLRTTIECLLGVRRRADAVEFDPVLAHKLDGLRARIPYEGGMLTLQYTVHEPGYGIRDIRIDGQPVPTTPLSNPYRIGGVSVPRTDLHPGAVIDLVVGSDDGGAR